MRMQSIIQVISILYTSYLYMAAASKYWGKVPDKPPKYTLYSIDPISSNPKKGFKEVTWATRDINVASGMTIFVDQITIIPSVMDFLLVGPFGHDIKLKLTGSIRITFTGSVSVEQIPKKDHTYWWTLVSSKQFSLFRISELLAALDNHYLYIPSILTKNQNKIKKLYSKHKGNRDAFLNAIIDHVDSKAQILALWIKVGDVRVDPVELTSVETIELWQKYFTHQRIFKQHDKGEQIKLTQTLRTGTSLVCFGVPGHENGAENLSLSYNGARIGMLLNSVALAISEDFRFYPPKSTIFPPSIKHEMAALLLAGSASLMKDDSEGLSMKMGSKAHLGVLLIGHNLIIGGNNLFTFKVTVKRGENHVFPISLENQQNWLVQPKDLVILETTSPVPEYELNDKVKNVPPLVDLAMGFGSKGRLVLEIQDNPMASCSPKSVVYRLVPIVKEGGYLGFSYTLWGTMDRGKPKGVASSEKSFFMSKRLKAVNGSKSNTEVIEDGDLLIKNFKKKSEMCVRLESKGFEKLKVMRYRGEKAVILHGDCEFPVQQNDMLIVIPNGEGLEKGDYGLLSRIDIDGVHDFDTMAKILEKFKSETKNIYLIVLRIQILEGFEEPLQERDIDTYLIASKWLCQIDRRPTVNEILESDCPFDGNYSFGLPTMANNEITQFSIKVESNWFKVHMENQKLNISEMAHSDIDKPAYLTIELDNDGCLTIDRGGIQPFLVEIMSGDNDESLYLTEKLSKRKLQLKDGDWILIWSYLWKPKQFSFDKVVFTGQNTNNGLEVVIPLSKRQDMVQNLFDYGGTILRIVGTNTSFQLKVPFNSLHEDKKLCMLNNDTETVSVKELNDDYLENKVGNRAKRKELIVKDEKLSTVIQQLGNLAITTPAVNNNETLTSIFDSVNSSPPISKKTRGLSKKSLFEKLQLLPEDIIEDIDQANLADYPNSGLIPNQYLVSSSSEENMHDVESGSKLLKTKVLCDSKRSDRKISPTVFEGKEFFIGDSKFRTKHKNNTNSKFHRTESMAWQQTKSSKESDSNDESQESDSPRTLSHNDEKDYGDQETNFGEPD